jgi:sec-independent protein translocase protein TatB
MSISHLVVIAVIALIVLGPEKMPQVARTLGKFMAEFRRITGDFRSTIETEMREMEREVALKEVREQFPENVHYDLQEDHTIAPPAATPEAPATDAAPVAAKTEAAAASGEPSNGEPHPA